MTEILCRWLNEEVRLEPKLGESVTGYPDAFPECLLLQNLQLPQTQVLERSSPMATCLVRSSTSTTSSKISASFQRECKSIYPVPKSY